MPRLTSNVSPPPEEIDGVRIEAYAAIDGDVEWRGKTGGPFVLVNDEIVGPVARLAIGLNSEEGDYLLLFCTHDWDAVAAAGGPSFEEAKARAEREYRGVSSKWIGMIKPGGAASR